MQKISEIRHGTSIPRQKYTNFPRHARRSKATGVSGRITITLHFHSEPRMRERSDQNKWSPSPHNCATSGEGWDEGAFQLVSIINTLRNDLSVPPHPDPLPTGEREFSIATGFKR